MSQHERTGWRDEEYSRRHRLYGKQLSMVDVDHFWFEFDNTNPVAGVECKEANAKEVTLQTYSIRCLINICDRLEIPAIFLRYHKESEAEFIYDAVVPLNTFAKNHFSRTSNMSEVEFVKLLYKIRGVPAPADDDLYWTIGWNASA